MVLVINCLIECECDVYIFCLRNGGRYGSKDIEIATDEAPSFFRRFW